MSARERFERTRKAVLRLNEVKALLMYDGDDWKPADVKAAHEASDPTANKAIYNVDELTEMLQSLRKEEAELEQLIGESMVIIDAVKQGFGEIYGYLLESRYIDCWTWPRIHDEYGIPKTTGHRLLDIAFDWIDSVGISKLLNSDYEL